VIPIIPKKGAHEGQSGEKMNPGYLAVYVRYRVNRDNEEVVEEEWMM